MKKLLILLLFPLMMFAQDSTLIGDVDCSGEVNSQDASLILQFVTNVIDELPCEANMTGLTPDQLQEMIDMMDEQLSINYTAGSGGGCDFRFPEGLDGDAITHDLINFNDYIVPTGKKLYILQHYAPDGTARIRIDGIPIKTSGNTNNYQYTLANPIIASSGQIITNGEDSQSVFNGIIVEENNDVQAITHDLINFNDYIVPDGKKLFILQHYAPGSSARIRIDGIPIKTSGNTNNYQYTLANPIVASSGQIITNGEDSQSVFNGYLVDEDYFADCSGGGGSTTNSVAETGASGFDLMFPEGYSGDIIIEEVDLLDNSYSVPEGKRLYIYNWVGNDIVIDGVIFDANTQNLYLPAIADEGSVISGESISSSYFNCLLVDKQSELEVIIEMVNSTDSSYEVPVGKKLFINHWRDYQIVIDGFEFPSGPLRSPFIVGEGSIVSGQNANPSYFNGYLVDEDYFSSADSGSNSTSDSGDVSVSQVGDTLFINGTSLIIPGISANNNSFETVLDGCGNEYLIYDYGSAGTWMLEDLRTNCFSDGSFIDSDEDGFFNDNGYTGLYSYNLVSGSFDSGKNLCPEGWHIPSREEWYELLLMYSEDFTSASTFCNSNVSPDILGFIGVGDLLSYEESNNFPYPNSSAFNVTNNTAGTGKKYMTSTQVPQSCTVNAPEIYPSAFFDMTFDFQSSYTNISTQYGYLDNTTCIRCIKD